MAAACPRLGKVVVALLAAAIPGVSHAACPQELAVYAEREDSASIDFRPAPPTAAVHSMEFGVVFAQDAVLEGIVMWTEGVARPMGIVMHECPEGDVTGEELAACTVWQGVIYALDDGGSIGLLPQRGEDAAQKILLPDFGPAVRHSSVYGPGGVSIVPWDVFELSGCQE